MNRRRFIKTGLIFVPTIFTCSGGIARLSNLHPQVANWMKRVKANSGNYTSKSVVCNDVMMKITNGFRSSILRWNTYTGLGLAAIGCPLINGGSSLTDAVINFDEADFSEGVGLAGNGTDEWLQAGAKQSDLYNLDGTNHSTFYGLYVITGSAALGITMGIYNGTQYDYLAVAYSDDKTKFSMSNNAKQMNITDPSGNGFYLGQNVTTTDAKVYKNGTQLATSSDMGTRQTSAYWVGVHALNNQNSSTPNEPTTKVLGGYVLGSLLDATQQATMNYAWKRGMGILGRSVA